LKGTTAPGGNYEVYHFEYGRKIVSNPSNCQIMKITVDVGQLSKVFILFSAKGFTSSLCETIATIKQQSLANIKPLKLL
jgi:hypothetical protein